MSVTLPLKDMSIEEKLQLMETLWDDLSQHADEVPPPEWHEKLLADREAALARGEETFEDWETAKQRIEREIGVLVEIRRLVDQRRHTGLMGHGFDVLALRLDPRLLRFRQARRSG